MKGRHGSFKQDLVSEVPRRRSKFLGLWQSLRGFGCPWYNQDETNMHSLTEQGFKIGSGGWSCPNSCGVRWSWGQLGQWKAVCEVVQDVFLPFWRNFQIAAQPMKLIGCRWCLLPLVVTAC